MSKLALIVLFAVLVGCVTANRPPRPVCRSNKGELIMGPGRACELICPRSKLHKPLEKCVKLTRPQCLCCRNTGYCRNTKTGKCNKLRRHH